MAPGPHRMISVHFPPKRPSITFTTSKKLIIEGMLQIQGHVSQGGSVSCVKRLLKHALRGDEPALRGAGLGKVAPVCGDGSHLENDTESPGYLCV
jgi:hypothetical protein